MTSCLQVVKDGAPVIIPDKDSGNVVPSVVAFRPNGKILVGEKARRYCSSQPPPLLPHHAAAHCTKSSGPVRQPSESLHLQCPNVTRYAVMGPSHTFHSVKRFIGRAADDPTVRPPFPALDRTAEISPALRLQQLPPAQCPSTCARCFPRLMNESCSPVIHRPRDIQVAEDRARVAYTVEEAGDEDDAAVLLCSTVDGGILYPEEVNSPRSDDRASHIQQEPGVVASATPSATTLGLWMQHSLMPLLPCATTTIPPAGHWTGERAGPGPAAPERRGGHGEGGHQGGHLGPGLLRRGAEGGNHRGRADRRARDRPAHPVRTATSATICRSPSPAFPVFPPLSPLFYLHEPFVILALSFIPLASRIPRINRPGGAAPNMHGSHRCKRKCFQGPLSSSQPLPLP